MTNDQREGLAKCIIEKGSDNEEIRFEKRFGTGYGKPVFPSFEDIPEDLSYFVGEDTLTTFKYLNLDFRFLNEPAITWENIPGYINAKSVVEKIKVVNDCAERGVKLAHDFIDCAKTEGRYQQTLQVIENDGNKCTNQRKRKKQSKSGSLRL